MLHILSVGLESKALGLHSSISSSVFFFEVQVHEQREHEAHGNHANEQTVAGEVARGILATEGETGDYTSKVTKSNMHGDTDSTFGRATDVVSIPGNPHGDIGIDTERISSVNAGIMEAFTPKTYPETTKNVPTY